MVKTIPYDSHKKDTFRMLGKGLLLSNHLDFSHLINEDVIHTEVTSGICDNFEQVCTNFDLKNCTFSYSIVLIPLTKIQFSLEKLSHKLCKDNISEDNSFIFKIVKFKVPIK
jgi:hypothetical protein